MKPVAAKTEEALGKDEVVIFNSPRSAESESFGENHPHCQTRDG